MKKRLFLILMLTLVIFLTGCGKENKEKLRQNFINDTSSLKGYYMEGVLSITNNDDTYNYDVKVGFKKDDNFKVLKKKEIYEFLEGNGPFLVTHNGTEYGLPYYTGTQLSS